ncbi:MAG: S41 family peptidase [Planctomycetaceae bacterium]|nr:S41 family peptidase [Planctomycetaceae bacterium]
MKLSPDPLGCCRKTNSTEKVGRQRRNKFLPILIYTVIALACFDSLKTPAPVLAQVTPINSQPLPVRSTPLEWAAQVPLLLPSDEATHGLPDWAQVSLASRLQSDETAGGGWRPVLSGQSSVPFPQSSNGAFGQEIESALDQLRDGRSNHSIAANQTSSAEGLNQTDSEVDPWVQTVLVEGQQLASGDRWSEALSIYQAALRKAPDSATLLKQRQTARMHVDLQGRLADAKYVHFARTDSVEMAAAHLNEILLKIELNHIEVPNWTKIFQHGLSSLLISLEHSEFQTKFLGRSIDDQVGGLQQRLRDSLNSVPVRNHNEFAGLAREVAHELQRQVGLPPNVTIHEFASTAASALDTYSTFLSPGHFDDLNSQIRGNFVGIGVELRSKKDCLEIVKAIPGGPADQARIRGGDKMLAVNDQLVSEIGGDPAADLLRGEAGTPVTVVVETPEGKQYRLKMNRARVEIPSIEETKLVDASNGIGYIKLSNFQKNTPADFDRAVAQLRQQGLRSLILDLRDNPGGALDAAVAIVDRFITRGTIVSTKGRNLAENMTYSAAQTSYIGNLPLIVLINENSASASEILAAAIADHKRGTIIGQRSFGKGVVQTIFPLTSGRGGIRLTTAEYFAPSGRRVEMQGVAPDLAVQTTARPIIDSAELESSENQVAQDEVLAAAIRRATNQNP